MPQSLCSIRQLTKSRIIKSNVKLGGRDLGDSQVSLTLSPQTIAKGFANDGQDIPSDGQVASLTSTNNFINFCLTTPNLPITNGKEITTGSCNPAPMGVIPSADFIPSCKFIRPQPFDTLFAGQTFAAELAIRNFQAGLVTNPLETYLSAPQVLSAQGEIQGHASLVIEEIDKLDQTTPLDPKKFVFFRTMTTAVDGVLTVNFTGGLPNGTYRLSTILRTQNFAPLLLPIEQRGSSNDVVYFTVTGGVSPGSVPAPSTDPFLDPKPPISTTTSGSNPSDTSIGQVDEVHHSGRAGIIAGVVLGVSAAILLTVVLLFRRGRRKRTVPLHNATIRPFLHTWPRTSRLFEASFLRPRASQKRNAPLTEPIPLTDIPSSHNAYTMSRESVVALREQGQATPVTMDEPTYQMFQEFLAAREQGLLPSDMDVPPSYEDIARSVRSLRRPNLVPNSKTYLTTRGMSNGPG